MTLPDGVRVVGVSGPTLGGSYKTPFVLALARSLVERGQAVAVAAHGYRARVRSPRRALPTDDVGDVGDDALFLARELDGLRVPVVVGKPWSAAVRLAASHAQIVLVDGLLQASPKPLGWSALVVDGRRSWESNRCPPAGDLRASPAALLAASDDIVEVFDRFDAPVAGSPKSDVEAPRTGYRAVFRVTSDIVAISDARSEMLPLDTVANRRVGLLAAVARPERIVAALAARRITPIDIRLFGDHRSLPERRWRARGRAPVDVWITTGKCSTKLGSHYEGKLVWTLVHRLALPAELVDRAVGN